MNQASVTASKERIQALWGMNVFLLFLKYAETSGLLTESYRQEIEGKITSFLEKENNTPAADYVKELNSEIDLLNKAVLKKGSYNSSFPQFSLASKDFKESAVLDQIDMIERTLSEAAKANVIEWSTEGSFFNDILKLFSNVEKRGVTPEEAMAKLVVELEKINKCLPEEYRFPLPDLNAYDF